MSLDQVFNLALEEKQLILNGPALAPPEGIVPNFENPPNRNDLAEITSITCLTIASVGMLLRIYAKVFCVRRLEIEDLLAIAAFGTFVGCIYCSYWMIGLTGLFVNQWNIQEREMSMSLYILHIASNLSAVTIMVIKASILIEWNRLFVPHCNLACIPHQKIWDKTIAEGSCIDVKSIYIPAATLNLLSDIISLQMSTKHKISISLIFTIGFLACVSASVKLAATVRFNYSDDTIYTMSEMYLWTLVEITCLFLVFCVPMAPKAVMDRRLIAKLGSSFSSIYRGINDNISLRRLYPTQTPPSTVNSRVEDRSSKPDGGILHTTQVTAVITTRDSYDDDAGTHDTHRQSFPWDGIH
ncbi:hypothetical protein F5X99DRAFT_416452 [Biscogniauxia marginata]|nr:hypothetical protein F5X99DRAFT_416452 [Biscogniauxia marginata]